MKKVSQDFSAEIDRFFRFAHVQSKFIEIVRIAGRDNFIRHREVANEEVEENGGDYAALGHAPVDFAEDRSDSLEDAHGLPPTKV